MAQAVKVSTFGERLRAARETCGISLEDAAYALRDRLDRPWRVGFVSISRWERNEVPENKVDPITLLALADVYDVDLAVLSTLAAGRLGPVRELLDRLSAEGGAVTAPYPFDRSDLDFREDRELVGAGV